MANGKSEFYSQIIQNTEILPINCGGAREVVISCKDVTNARNIAFITNSDHIWAPNGDLVANNYFMLPDMNAGHSPIVIHTNDEYLYVSADGVMWVQVWVIR